jgi:hypothetical protein
LANLGRNVYEQLYITASATSTSYSQLRKWRRFLSSYGRELGFDVEYLATTDTSIYIADRGNVTSHPTRNSSCVWTSKRSTVDRDVVPADDIKTTYPRT